MDRPWPTGASKNAENSGCICFGCNFVGTPENLSNTNSWIALPWVFHNRTCVLYSDLGFKPNQSLKLFLDLYWVAHVSQGEDWPGLGRFGPGRDLLDPHRSVGFGCLMLKANLGLGSQNIFPAKEQHKRVQTCVCMRLHGRNKRAMIYIV